MNAALRRASAADLDQILAIERAWPTSPGWTREHFQRELASELAAFWVAESGGRVAAFACMTVLPPEAQVLDVAVRPELARRGLGRAVMERLAQEAAAAGCDTMTLEVSAANGAALKLYEGLGFGRVGRRPRYYRDGSDAWLMTLRLPITGGAEPRRAADPGATGSRRPRAPGCA